MKRHWLFFAAALLQTAAAADPKPNIVLIHCDDLGYAEIGCFGQEKIKTPNLDKLAAGGQRWTQYYSGSPVCSPSRNVLLTGRHGGGCVVQDLKRVNPQEKNVDSELGGDWPISADTYTLQTALKKAGYDTATFGKWGLGEFGTTGAPDKHGTDIFYGYTDQRVCHSFYPEFLWNNGRKEIINTPGISGHQTQPEGVVDDDKYRGQKHASVLIIDQALKFVDSRKPADKPFFLYYAPLEPHVALQPPAEWVGKYPKEWDAAPYRGERGYLPHSRPRAAYAATISFLDYNIGQLLDRLKERGLENNTLVIFTSDNGTTHDVGGVDHKFFNSLADLRGAKGQTYEGGIRVPAIVSWPGHVPAGVTVEQPAYHADIMPSLCSLTGADAGAPYGENILPLWLGQKKSLENRKAMVWCTGGYGGQAAVRIGDMKAERRNLYPSTQGPANWEVYDLANDRGETQDLAADRRDVIKAAEEVLRREYKVAPGFKELAIFASEKTAEAAEAKAKPGEAVFKKLDTDSNGKLTFEEWQGSPKAKATAAAERNAVFDGLDTDKNNALSGAEFGSQFQNK